MLERVQQRCVHIRRPVGVIEREMVIQEVTGYSNYQWIGVI